MPPSSVRANRGGKPSALGGATSSRAARNDGAAPVRTAELLGRLTLACDAAADTAPGMAVRSTVLAVELGKLAGATARQLRETYWLTLLGHLSGTGFARDRGTMSERLVAQRRDVLASVLSDHRQGRAGFSTDARETTELSSCLYEIAQLVELARDLDGRDAALETARRLGGDHFDPLVSRALGEQGEALFEAVDDPHIFERFLELEPGPVEWADERGLDCVACALAAFADLASPIFVGHSTGVAALAARTAFQLGLGDGETRALRLGALLHDIGRVSVPQDIWARRGPLDWAAWERVRLHTHFTGRVLWPIRALAEVADIATSAHERLDGSGYPQHRSARTLSAPARVLAAAHAAHSMSEDRPHRLALDSDAIARELVLEAAAGRLDPRAVDAVLACLGLPDRAAPPSSHGLSGRELEVSQLLARGKSDREIGASLHISPRTVQVHVARILDKLGVRSRAGAAIWLIEHDLAS